MAAVDEAPVAGDGRAAAPPDGGAGPPRAHQDRVWPLWLPAYAPELNLVERVWRHLKDKLSCHRWWADLDALEAATAALLAQLRARFHQPDPGGIALVQDFCEAA